MADSARRQQLAAMLKDDPNDSFLRYALAMEHISAGDADAAVAELKRLLTATPEYVPAYHQLGQLLIRQGSIPEAQECLREGIRRARQVKDDHTAEEMLGLLAST